jgi:hypothetical protein
MPNVVASFGSNVMSNVNGTNGWWLMGGLFIALLLVAIVVYLAQGVAVRCVTELERQTDGSLKSPDGTRFPDMNAFQQWWAASGNLERCPLPLLKEADGRTIMKPDDLHEETYAKTPIYKADDYEFSRIFGYERDGRMVVPHQNFNMILEQRTFDWADMPMTSDERRGKYRGLQEGFTATGELKSETLRMNELKSETLRMNELKSEKLHMDPAKEAAARFGESRTVGDADLDCKMSREAKEVAGLVAKAYESDPHWEPVVTRVGVNHWEVNELKPKHRDDEDAHTVEERVVDTNNDRVNVDFRYREKRVTDAAIDPYFPVTEFKSERHSPTGDAFYGPVPGMERMFAPTFDQDRWY